MSNVSAIKVDDVFVDIGVRRPDIENLIIAPDVAPVVVKPLDISITKESDETVHYSPPIYIFSIPVHIGLFTSISGGIFSLIRPPTGILSEIYITNVKTVKLNALNEPGVILTEWNREGLRLKS